MAAVRSNVEKKAEGSSLPVQFATLDILEKTVRCAVDVRLSASEIAASIDDVGAVRRSLKVAQDQDVKVGDMESMLDSENMRHRFGVCEYILMAKGAQDLIESIAGYVEQFAAALYPTHPYVWSESELESAKAEAEFGARAVGAVLDGTSSRAPELRSLYSALDILRTQLRGATYQGQAMELQSRISVAQLELIGQQAEVLRRFDEQDRKMERMNRWINRFSIAAAIAAVAALILQALEVFHVIP